MPVTIEQYEKLRVGVVVKNDFYFLNGELADNNFKLSSNFSVKIRKLNNFSEKNQKIKNYFLF